MGFFASSPFPRELNHDRVLTANSLLLLGCQKRSVRSFLFAPQKREITSSSPSSDKLLLFCGEYIDQGSMCLVSY